jgi:hypothetical protein
MFLQKENSWWQFFKRTPDLTGARCLLCGSFISCGKSRTTTSAARHLLRFHPQKYNEKLEADKQLHNKRQGDVKDASLLGVLDSIKEPSASTSFLDLIPERSLYEEEERPSRPEPSSRMRNKRMDPQFRGTSLLWSSEFYEKRMNLKVHGL